MSLPKEYIEELNVLNKKIAQDQPKDVIEYCAAHFNNRLSTRRNQPFRNASVSHHGSANSGAPFFKSPFASNDPHATLSEDPHSSPNYIEGGDGDNGQHHQQSQHDSDNDSGPGGPTAGNSQDSSRSLFKNSFGGGPSAHNNDEARRRRDQNLRFKSSAIPSTFNAFRRPSVSAETLNPNSFQNDDWKPPVHDLTPEQLSRLNKSIVKNFLFSNLEDDALNTVLHALQEKSFAKDSTIIKQGDEGDFFYLIERGEVAFFVNDKFVSSASTGASFGELALMYNSARAATVKAKTDVIVWALDRLTFRRILLEVTAKKRLMYEEFLKDVKILSDLSSYQRSKLADALHTEVYPPNSTIVEEGAVGENFYLIESGTAEIYKNNEGFIGSISKGDYFGEIALLNDLPRQASVKAKSTVKVATLGKSGFQRLLGPVVEVLKAQDPRKQENIAA